MKSMFNGITVKGIERIILIIPLTCLLAISTVACTTGGAFPEVPEHIPMIGEGVHNGSIMGNNYQDEYYLDFSGFRILQYKEFKVSGLLTSENQFDYIQMTTIDETSAPSGFIDFYLTRDDIYQEKILYDTVEVPNFIRFIVTGYGNYTLEIKYLRPITEKDDEDCGWLVITPVVVPLILLTTGLGILKKYEQRRS
jgi:hypothetical protein